MKCAHCGADLSDSARFCTVCGKTVAAGGETVELGEMGVPITAEAGKPKKKKFPVGGVIVAALAAVIACFVVLGMFCRAPLPIFNRTFARYVPGYHGIYIGMPKDKAIEKLKKAGFYDIHDKINGVVIINTMDEIRIDGWPSVTEQVFIEKGKVKTVMVYYPREAKDAVEKHYMDLFGLKNAKENSSNGLYFTTYESKTDHYGSMGSKKLDIDIFDQHGDFFFVSFDD